VSVCVLNFCAPNHYSTGVLAWLGFGDFLRSYDIANLYIMDGSVIPDALGVNPQVTIMGLAHHATTLLAEKLKSV